MNFNQNIDGNPLFCFLKRRMFSNEPAFRRFHQVEHITVQITILKLEMNQSITHLRIASNKIYWIYWVLILPVIHKRLQTVMLSATISIWCRLPACSYHYVCVLDAQRYACLTIVISTLIPHLLIVKDEYSRLAELTSFTQFDKACFCNDFWC